MTGSSWRRRLLRRLGMEASGELDRLLARAASASLGIKVASAGLAFLLHMLLARLLGSAEYGDYAYALTWIGLIGLVCAAGMDTAAVRFVGSYVGAERWSELRGFRRRALGIVGGLSGLAAALLAAGAWLARDALGHGLAVVFVLAALLIPVNVLLNVSTSVLQGLKRVVLAMAPTGVVRPVLLAALVLGWFVLSPRPLDAATAIVLNLAAALAVLALVWILMRRSLPGAARSRQPAYETRRWVAVALPLLFLSGMHLLIRRTDILMIGVLIDTEAAGIYTVGSRTAEFAAFGLSAANVIVAPLIAELHTREERDDLQRVFTLGARGSFLFALLVTLGLVTVGGPLLGLFGPEFRNAYGPMLVLASGQTLGAFVGSVGYLMTMTGQEREMSVVLGVAAVANVALNAALIPLFGLMGAAAATTLSLVAWNVALAWIGARRLGIRTTAAARLRGEA